MTGINPKRRIVRKGLLEAGVAAITVGAILIVLAVATFTETVVLNGISLRTANSSLLYSGVGLMLLGILLIILSAAELKKPNYEARRETAGAGAEEKTDIIKILIRSYRSLIDNPGFILLYLIPFMVMVIFFAHVCLTLGTWTPWISVRNYSTLINFVKDWALWIIVYVIATVITMLTAQAAIILRAAALKRGETMSLGDALAEGIRRVPNLLVALVAAGAIIIGPLLLLIWALVFAPTYIFIFVFTLVLIWFIPMFYISIRLALIAQACVLENLGPIGSMKESWNTTKGNFWLIFVMIFLFGVVSALANLIPIFGFLVATFLVGPAGIIAYTLVYISLREARQKKVRI
ncbi:MAG: hypothetical protein QXG10_02580 [Candidatus Hadarchaeales archaeon]